MVKLNRLYTRQGDKGETTLVDGSKILKCSPQVSAYGEIDELNSALGMARTLAEELNQQEITRQIARIQNDLFDIGAELASPPSADMPQYAISSESINQLEQWIDSATELTGELRSFVLPGGNQLNATLHLARAICRRAERSLLAFHKESPAREVILIYINRLSDLLFALSRVASKNLGSDEYLWKPGGEADS